MNIERLLRPNIRSLKPYTSAREEHSGMNGIFLDANENSLEPVYGVGLNRYPDPRQKFLKTKISNLKSIDPERIFLGNGSDEPIDLLIRAFCEPGRDQILAPAPTYGMYQVCADINAVGVKKVDLTTEFQLNIDGILKEIDDKTKLIFLCSPNNPTGNTMYRGDVRALLEAFEGLVVIDEAYIDFSKETGWLDELDEHENLVVLQTFSKAWGLASARVGMAFAAAEIIEVLTRIKYPYNINGLSQDLVLRALDLIDKKDYLVERILSERKELEKQLGRLSIVQRIFPSQANFLLVRFTNSDVVYEELLQKFILIRDRSGHRLTRNCLRITVGSPAENRALIDVLQEMDN